MFRVGLNHTYVVYVRYFRQGNHQVYGAYTVCTYDSGQLYTCYSLHWYYSRAALANRWASFRARQTDGSMLWGAQARLETTQSCDCWSRCGVVVSRITQWGICSCWGGQTPTKGKQVGLCRGGRKQWWKPLGFVTVYRYVECGCAVGGVCISNSVRLKMQLKGCAAHLVCVQKVVVVVIAWFITRAPPPCNAC